MGFLAGALIKQSALVVESIPMVQLLAMFVACIPIMLVVIGLQRINPWSASAWQYPDWALNPFELREPVQFFHFTGYVLLAAGLGSLARTLSGAQVLTAETQILVVAGAGQLCGVYACIAIFRSKMAPREQRGPGPRAE
jgi:hypothetical protein